MNLPSELSDFAGNWNLTRVIRDARAKQIVKAEGHANLSRCDTGLTYDEEVTLFLPGQDALKGTRRYFWNGANDRVAIHFDDGRYFHALKLGVPTASDHHDCPPDSYDAQYDFTDWPHWKVRWIVSGPRKSYEMDTEYRQC